MPKFSRWQSPQACTRSPVLGVVLRSCAMSAAEPRRKVKGLRSMRPERMGTSSGRRSRFDSSRMAMGSRPFAFGFHAA
jgi:hypothetical protein